MCFSIFQHICFRTYPVHVLYNNSLISTLYVYFSIYPEPILHLGNPIYIPFVYMYFIIYLYMYIIIYLYMYYYTPILSICVLPHIYLLREINMHSCYNM